jgi:isocitrate/isopropylmalate dehydrogenase
MLDYLKLEGGEKIRGAINTVLEERRKLTPDLGGKSTTEEITEAIISKI